MKVINLKAYINRYFKKVSKFNLSSKPVVVADRSMLNNDNLAYLETNGYKYIIPEK